MIADFVAFPTAIVATLGSEPLVGCNILTLDTPVLCAGSLRAGTSLPTESILPRGWARVPVGRSGRDEVFVERGSIATMAAFTVESVSGIAISLSSLDSVSPNSERMSSSLSTVGEGAAATESAVGGGSLEDDAVGAEVVGPGFGIAGVARFVVLDPAALEPPEPDIIEGAGLVVADDVVDLDLDLDDVVVGFDEVLTLVPARAGRGLPFIGRALDDGALPAARDWIRRQSRSSISHRNI